MSGEQDSGSDVTTITVYPDGPLLVRGPARIRTPQGEEYVNSRAVRALCRCGKSASKPWCDGTHKVARFRAPQDVIGNADATDNAKTTDGADTTDTAGTPSA